MNPRSKLGRVDLHSTESVGPKVTNILRYSLALLASLTVGIVAAQGLGRTELALLTGSAARNRVVVAGILANLFIVPLAAGFVLGLIARGALLPLSFASLVLSLAASVAFMGAAGLPEWSKAFTYIMQWALLYLAARFGARLLSHRCAVDLPDPRSSPW